MVWSKSPKLKQNNLHLICQNIGYGPLTSWFANFDIKHCISRDFILPKFFAWFLVFCFEKSADIFARKFKCYNNNMCATVIFFKTLGHTFNWPLRPHCSASDATLMFPLLWKQFLEFLWKASHGFDFCSQNCKFLGETVLEIFAWKFRFLVCSVRSFQKFLKRPIF